MTDTAKQTPLWRTMQEATLDLNATVGECYAAEIRAIMGWLVPKGEPLDPIWFGTLVEHEFNFNQQIRALLTVEAERAERGND